MKKIFLSLVLLLGLSAATFLPNAEAKNSESGIVNTGYWKQLNGKWYHYTWIGKSYGWIIFNNKSYYLDISTGAMVTGWFMDLGSGKWYYLQSDGVMKTGWFLEKGKWYFLDRNDGEMKIGWFLDKGVWYYMDKSGVMKTGWVKDNNKWYYLQTSGAMKTGWLLDNGSWYFLDKNGAMKTGWLRAGEDYYYLDPAGKMKTGWFEDLGSRYFLDPNGKMARNSVIDGYTIVDSGKAFRTYTREELIKIAEEITNIDSFRFDHYSVSYDEDAELVLVTDPSYNNVIAAAGNGYIGGSDKDFVTTLAYAIGAPMEPSLMEYYWDELFWEDLDYYEGDKIGIYYDSEEDWMEMYWGINWEE